MLDAFEIDFENGPNKIHLESKAVENGQLSNEPKLRETLSKFDQKKIESFVEIYSKINTTNNEALEIDKKTVLDLC